MSENGDILLYQNEDAGSVSRNEMKQVVIDEYEIYKRKMLETGDTNDVYTKDDFERAIDKSAEQVTPTSRGEKK